MTDPKHREPPFYVFPPRAVEDLMLLRHRGGHLVLCSPIRDGVKKAKAAVTPEWQKNPAGADAVHAAVTAERLIGIVPASLGFTVIDVDGDADQKLAGEEHVIKTLGPPLAAHDTHPAGGRHIWYLMPDDAPVGNKTWHGPGRSHGQVRGSRGYVVAWQPAAIARALGKAARGEPLPRAKLNEFLTFTPLLKEQPDGTAPADAKPPAAKPRKTRKKPAPKPHTGLHVARDWDLAMTDFASLEHSDRNNALFVYTCTAHERFSGSNLQAALDRIAELAGKWKNSKHSKGGRPTQAVFDTMASAAKHVAGKRPARPKPAPAPPADADGPDFQPPEHVYSEETLGREFLSRFGRDILHVQETGDWKAWENNQWVERSKKVVSAQLMALGHETWQAKNKDGGWEHRPQLGGKRTNAAGAAVTAAAPLLTRNGDWDAQPDVIGLPDGKLIEVRDGELVTRDRKRSDRVSRSLPVVPAPHEKWGCGRWREHLAQCFKGDDTLVPALQVLIGQALLGRGQEDLILMGIGTARTGKGTTLGSIMRAFGTYGGSPDTSSIVSTRGLPVHSQRHLPYMGLRFALISEPEENAQLDSSFLKKLAGGGVIRARGMRQDDSVFTFRGVVCIDTNFEPGVISPDPGLRRRMRIFRFRNRIPDDREIPGYRYSMPLDEVAGWLLAGAQRYLRSGVGRMPKSVLEANREWAEQADPLSAFVAERCVLDPAGIIGIEELHSVYTTWIKDDEGGNALPKRRFVKKLIEGFQGVRRGTSEGVRGTDGVKVILGIRLAK